MHSSGWIYSIVASANSASSLRGWMQSTGQTSTQAVSFVSIQGSVMMNGMLASLRNVRDGVSCPATQFPGGGPDRSAFRTRTGELYRETARGQLRVALGGGHA